MHYMTCMHRCIYPPRYKNTFVRTVPHCRSPCVYTQVQDRVVTPDDSVALVHSASNRLYSVRDMIDNVYIARI